MGTLLIHWTPFLLIALIAAVVLLRTGLVRTGVLETQPMNETSRWTYAILAFAFSAIAAALTQSMDPIPQGIVMAMFVYYQGVHYRRMRG